MCFYRLCGTSIIVLLIALNGYSNRGLPSTNEDVKITEFDSLTGYKVFVSSYFFGYKNVYRTYYNLGIQSLIKMDNYKYMMFSIGSDLNCSDAWIQSGGIVNNNVYYLGSSYYFKFRSFYLLPTINLAYSKQDIETLQGYVRFNGIGLRGGINFGFEKNRYGIGLQYNCTFSGGESKEKYNTPHQVKVFRLSFIDNLGISINYKF